MKSLRRLARSPWLTATLVLTIAIGAGVNAAIFGFVGGLVTHGTGGADPADAERFARAAVLLFIACGVVMLIACATVVGLLLSRSSALLLETAVKVAIGATRGRLARQQLADSLLVTVLGGALGLLFALWTSHLVPLLFFAEDAEQLTLTPSLAWLVTAAGVWVVVMALCGLVPVLTIPHRDPALILRRDASRSSNAARTFRNRLVVMQIALCSILVVVAGVIRADLQASIRTMRGRSIESLLVTTVRSDAGPFDDINGMAFIEALEQAALKLPGVTAAAWTFTLPAGRAAPQTVAVELPDSGWRDIRLDVARLSPEDWSAERLRPESGRMFGAGDSPGACRVAILNQAAANQYFEGDAVGRSMVDALGTPLEIIGVVRNARPNAEERPTLYYYDAQKWDGAGKDILFRAAGYPHSRPQVELDVNVTSPEYFDVYADPPIEGRIFDSSDARGRCRVGVVSEEAARTIFGGRAIGAAVTGPHGDRIEIVGVVRSEALGVTRRAADPTLFVPLAQAYRQVMTLAMRSSDTSPQFRAQVREVLDGVEGGRVLSPVSTFAEHLARTSLAAARIASTLVIVCAALALALSLAGVYAVIADLVGRRQRELALRMALGAGAWRLVRSVVWEAWRLAALGSAAGILPAVAGTPLLDRFVVAPQLPGPMVLAAGVIAVGALVTLASVVPAWQAISVDPRAVMHDE